MTVLLRTSGLIKEYGRGGTAVRALDGVDLDIAAGRFVSIMGPSGSGKSTLLHLLAGLDTPTSGEVWFAGQRLSSLSDRARSAIRRERVALVFQQFNLIPVLTAAENVALPLVINRSDAATRKRKVAEKLALVGLSDHADQLPAALSGGEQQRVAIARAMVTEPTVLFADEPTGSLDSATGAQVLEVIRAAQRDLGQTVVLVTHDPRVAAAGDEIVRLHDGVVVERHPVRRRCGTAKQQLSAAIEEEICGV